MIIDGGDDTIRIARIGPRQVGLLIAAALVLFTDGFDAQIVSFVAPALVGAWRLSKAALAPVFAANIFGLMLGAIVITPLADVFSRRSVTFACVSTFAVLTLGAPLTTTLTQLAVLRFVTGLVLGAAMPSMIVASSEYLPARVRGRWLGVLICAFSFGLAGAGFAASWLVPAYGWTSMFRVGGIMPLVMLPLLWVFLPESPVYLAARGRIEDLRRVARRMGGELQPAVPVSAKARFPATSLFLDGMAPVTLRIWIAYFCSGVTVYFLGNWLPLLMTGAGYGLRQAGLVTAAYQFGGIAGAILVGYLVDRRGALALSLVVLAASLVVMATGWAAGDPRWLFPLVALSGVCVVGGQNGMNAFVGSSLYPATFRVTGLGWALGVTRLAGVLAGSLGAGYVIGLNLAPSRTFLIIGAPEILGAVALFQLSRGRRRAVAMQVAPVRS